MTDLLRRSGIRQGSFAWAQRSLLSVLADEAESTPVRQEHRANREVLVMALRVLCMAPYDPSRQHLLHGRYESFDDVKRTLASCGLAELEEDDWL